MISFEDEEVERDKKKRKMWFLRVIAFVFIMWFQNYPCVLSFVVNMWAFAQYTLAPLFL